MKNVNFFFCVLVLFPFLSVAQILDPVKWNFKTEQSKPGEATLIFTANIENKWHLYSQDIPKDGPIPTSFTFTIKPDYEIVGKVNESKSIAENDQLFKITLKYFENKAVFTQKIKVLNAKPFKVTGTLEFMCCDDKQCIPPAEVEFSFDIKGNTMSGKQVAPVTVKDTSAKSGTTSVVAVPDKQPPIEKQTPATHVKAGMSKTKLDTGQQKSLFWFFII